MNMNTETKEIFLFIGGPLHNTIKEIPMCKFYYGYEYGEAKVTPPSYPFLKDVDLPKMIEYRAFKFVVHGDITPQTVFTCLSDSETLKLLMGKNISFNF